MLRGFKDFISRGNVVDLAVGVVIGGAFGNVVTKLVEGIINPLIAGLIGQPNFDSVGAFSLGEASVQPGLLITAVVQFLLIAAAIYFTVVLPMNKLAEKRAAKNASDEAEEAAAPSTEDLLAEIRDLLAQK